MKRSALLETVASLLPEGRVLLGIDGVDASGKTTFAEDLAPVIAGTGRSVSRISLDDFHNPRAVRHMNTGPEGFWLNSYDYPAIWDKVLTPLRSGGSGRYCARHHDVRTEEWVEPAWEQLPPDGVAVVDGIFLLRDELRDVWDLSVFLQVPFEVSVPRMSARDGDGKVSDPADPRVARYVGGQRLYFDACTPWDRADLVVDNSDPDEPLLLRSPSLPVDEPNALPRGSQAARAHQAEGPA